MACMMHFLPVGPRREGVSFEKQECFVKNGTDSMAMMQLLGIKGSWGIGMENDRETNQGHAHGHPGTANSAVLRDPVCGMEVGKEADHRYNHAGMACLYGSRCCFRPCCVNFHEKADA
jgi:hypothetical protein